MTIILMIMIIIYMIYLLPCINFKKLKIELMIRYSLFFSQAENMIIGIL